MNNASPSILKKSGGGSWIFSRTGIDTRSLSFFRILLGISLLYNAILVRGTYITEFLGAHTVIPKNVLREMNGANSFSVFDIIQSDIFAYIYFSLFLLSIVLFTLGFYTKYIAPITCFLYWNILQASSSFVFGFDFFTFQLLFWSCFLPLDLHFSIRKSKQVSGIPVIFMFVLLYQIAWVYFASGWGKYGISWINGYAVRNMLMDVWAAKPLAKYVVNNTFFYTVATYTTLVFECIFPLLLFIRSPRNILRYIAVSLLILLHTFIFLFYNVANFSLSGIAVAALILPSSFWEMKFFRNRIPSVTLPAYVFKNKLRQRTAYIFAAFALFVITEKNILFLSKYSALGNDTTTTSATNLSVIDIPSPVKVSFFTQFWKMFAPNPPAKAGWLALEKKMPDGSYRDFFTDKVILETPEMNWKPSGMEYYLLMYARTFDHPDGGGTKFKIFLKYWIPYKLAQYHFPLENIDQIVFADYLYIVADQSKPHIPETKFNVYEAKDIVNTRYKIEKL